MKFGSVANDLLKTAVQKIGESSPEILIGFSIAGVISANVLTAMAVPKAQKKLKAKRLAKKRETGESKLTVIETVKTAGPYFVPAAVATATSIGCMLGSHHITSTRTAALAAMNEITQQTLSDFKEATRKELGDEKTKEIERKVEGNRRNRAEEFQTPLIACSEGDQLYRDAYSGREFKSSPNKIDAAINTMNRIMIYDQYASLSDWYDCLGLPHIAHSDEKGWELGYGTNRFDVTPLLAQNENGYSLIELEFGREPGKI